jgi:hypothetical protein
MWNISWLSHRALSCDLLRCHAGKYLMQLSTLLPKFDPAQNFINPELAHLFQVAIELDKDCLVFCVLCVRTKAAKSDIILPGACTSWRATDRCIQLMLPIWVWWHRTPSPSSKLNARLNYISFLPYSQAKAMLPGRSFLLFLPYILATVVVQRLI